MRASLARSHGFLALFLVAAILSSCSQTRPTEPPAGKVEPVRLDFGQVIVGQAADRSFTMHNAGREPLSGTVQASCPEFTLVSGAGPYSLGAEQSLEVVIRFRPASAGSKGCGVSTGNSIFGTIGCSGVGAAIPTGACCDPTGTCTLTTEAECRSPAVWQGPDTGCEPNPCAQPMGACCASDGTCSVTTEAACAAPAVWTMFSECDPNPCSQPTGSCCASDGTCSVITEAACAAPAVWTMFGECDPNPCAQPSGSCCAAGGTCAVTTEAACAAPAVWTMFGACDPNPCPQPPTGACCTPSGTCSLTTQASCTSANVWHGAGTVCSPNPCPQPTGACCTPSGTCSLTTQTSCPSPNVWQGAGTICSPNPCPQPPTGACCAPGGTCTLTTQTSCTSPNVWHGAGTVCFPNPCPQPTGACCTPSGTCTLTTEASCHSPNIWLGANILCSPNPCPPPTITLSPTSLPDGTTGVPYSRTITASGGTAPYSFVVSAGVLPTGLNLSSSGNLTGTPSGAGSFSFTVRATDALSFTGTRAYSVTITAGGTLDLTIPTVYITQSAQTPAFDVPLVRDRNGFIRAFVTADHANGVAPQVRVRIYSGGVPIQTYTISAPGAAVPLAVDESSLANSWNQTMSGTVIQPGYSLLVEVDPSNLIAESNESNNVWPASGTPWPLDVRDLPILNMTLIPMNTISGTGNVSAGNAASFMDYTRRLHPIPDYDAQVRAVMNSTAVLGADGTGWDILLNELTAQRTADGSDRYYFGVAHVSYTSGVAGIGWIGYPVATGWDYLPSGSWTMAHEIGHNWSCQHTQCTGGESGVDPNYPYAGGAIGIYGYDLWASSLKDRTVCKDVMSYCSTRWISDYTYKKVLAFREGSPIGYRQQSVKESCLLIWGLQRHGEILLEPAFSLSMSPSIPAPGPYRAEGVDAGGDVLWSQDFDLMQTTHPTDPTSAGFCFAIPISTDVLDRVATIRIVAGGVVLARRSPSVASRLQGPPPEPASLTWVGGEIVDLSWDASREPVVMVRDPDRDECIGFARDGRARISSCPPRLQLLFSDGVHTRVEELPSK